jgi:hypothetical protein
LIQTDISVKDLSQNFVPPAFTDGVGQIPDNFDLLNDVEFTNLVAIIGLETFGDSNSGPPGQLDFLDEGLQEDATNLPNTNTAFHAASQLTAFQPNNMDALMLRPPLLTPGTLQPQLNQSLLVHSSEVNQANDRSGRTPPSSMLPLSTSPQQIAVPVQTPRAGVQTQNPQQNADEKLTCNHIGCENMQFDRKCEWQ